jgi:hypothetical protein
MNIDGELSNHDLIKWCKLLQIPLRGVYMIDTLPNKILKNENCIVNLDTQSGHGTHWVGYKKRGSNVYYFDPIGNLQPPYELNKYWKKETGVNIFYNVEHMQPLHTNICGHLMLLFFANQL